MPSWCVLKSAEIGLVAPPPLFPSLEREREKGGGGNWPQVTQERIHFFKRGGGKNKKQTHTKGGKKKVRGEGTKGGEITYIHKQKQNQLICE